MNLYLKQKVFSWGDKFTVYDEAGNDLFYVQGEVFTLGKKLHILNLAGEEECYIRQKLLTFLPKYYVSKNGVDVAEVIKEFTLFRQEYTVNGFGWKVEGDFFAHEYRIVAAGNTVAQISKQWVSFGDAYQISVADWANPINALAVVLIIDACLDAAQNSSNS